MTGFKVVRKYGRLLVSCFAFTLRSGNLVYTVGSIVRPEPDCGPIAVFDTLYNVETYLINNINNLYTAPNYEIYECEYAPSDKKSVWYSYIRSDELIDTVAMPLDLLPVGTILAESVTLIRLIGK